MYMIPGYTTYYEKNGALYVSSQLLQNTVKITDHAIQNEFHTIVQNGGCSDLSTPLTQFLHEQELLVSNEEIVIALEKVKQLLQDRLLLTIMPTEGCNFRCPYCYEDHIPVSMTRQLLNQLQAYISEQVSRFKLVTINWFGGEPTLCKDTIIETSKLIKHLQSKYSFQYTASMTTNGYLLNVKNFLQFYAVGITNYQITLDGWEHDKTRPHMTGKGTLQEILNNLIALSKLPANKYPFQVTLRRNLLEGDTDYSWYDYLYKLFGGDKRFSVSVATVGDWGGESVKTLDLSRGKEKILLRQAHETYLDKLGMRRVHKENALFSDICYASYPNSFVFRADGKIEKCTIALNHPKNLVGHLDPDNGVIIDEDANHLWCHSDLQSKCHTCPNILSCLNICCRRGVLVDNNPDGVCPCAEI